MAPAGDKLDDRSMDREAAVSNSYNFEAARCGKNEQLGSRGSTEDVVLLDDLAFCIGRGKFALSEMDLHILDALLSVLESGQPDISIKRIGVAVSDELEWA